MAMATIRAFFLIFALVVKTTIGMALLLFTTVSISAPVDDRAFIDFGGNEVYLEISGPSRDAPLLVYLHGGPGSIADLVTFQSNVGRQLEQDFLVVYFHQRGVGKSSAEPDLELSNSAHISDLHKVVTYLKKTYGQGKVRVVGQSWGGMLAGLYASEHSEDIEKLVFIATALNVKTLLRDSYDVALRWAQKEDSSEAVIALTALDDSFETPEHFMVVLSWANRAGGLAPTTDFDALLKGLNVDSDYPDWREREAHINGAMMEELLRIDLDDEISALDIPALFVSGARDTIVSETTMRRDYGRYRGEKEFVLLEESHHLPHIDQPDALARVIRDFLQ